MTRVFGEGTESKSLAEVGLGGYERRAPEALRRCEHEMLSRLTQGRGDG